MEASSEVTQLLMCVQGGDRTALDRLAPLLYGELRQLAASMFGRERAQRTLQPTAVVHEAYLRLVKQDRLTFQTRSHFLAIAARFAGPCGREAGRRRG